MEFTGERFIPEALRETDETYQEHIQRYQFATPYVAGLTALDAACGVGYGSGMLATTANRVCGVDIDPDSIAYAREKFSKPNLEFHALDIRTLQYPDSSFDVVVSFETIEHISFQEQFLQEVRRVLKTDGMLILSTPNRETVPKGKTVRTPYHVREFTLHEILNLLRDRGFGHVETFCQKMSYHSWLLKRFRLLSRYPKERLRGRIVSLLCKRYATLEKTPLFLRILLYEYRHKATVLPFTETHRSIKPEFYVLVCRKA